MGLRLQVYFENFVSIYPPNTCPYTHPHTHSLSLVSRAHPHTIHTHSHNTPTHHHTHILTASHWFPYVKKRIQVIDQEQFELSAIEVRHAYTCTYHPTYHTCSCDSSLSNTLADVHISICSHLGQSGRFSCDISSMPLPLPFSLHPCLLHSSIPPPPSLSCPLYLPSPTSSP